MTASLRAASLNWDADGNPTNGLGGSATWDTAALRFDDNGTAPDLAWSNPGDTAVFTGTAGTVSLGEPIFAGGLSFDVQGYTLTGNSLTLTGTPAISVTNATDDATISSALAGLIGFTKTGAGTLTLKGNSTYAGTTQLSAGRIYAASNTALGLAGLANGTSIAAGASLFLTAGITVGETFTVSGQLGNFGGFNTLTSTVSVQNGATLIAAAGRLTLGSLLSLDGTLANASITMDGAGEIVVPSTITLGSGVLTKTGSGTLTFNQTLTALPANVAFAAGTLGFMGPQNLGAVSVPSGRSFKFYNDPGLGTTVTAGLNASVIAGYALDQALLSRISGASSGAVLLGADSTSALDLTGKGITLGAADGRTFKLSGALTADAGGYRLGAGDGTLEVSSALGASPVTIGGRTLLSNRANAQLNSTVGPGGRLIFSSNDQLGAPTAPITLNDGGVLELAQTTNSTNTIFTLLGNPTAPNAARPLTLTGTGGTIDIPASATGAG